jgi:nicotinamidase-related amidase
MPTALLIIDMQAGAAQWNTPPFYQMNELVGRLQRVIAQAREKAVPVFYAQHYNPEGFAAYGSPEWELIPEIGPREGDVVIHKMTPDVFLGTTLHEQLQSLGIERLVIGGIQTADCVDTTCRRAFSLGYQVVLLADGHTTFDSPVLKAPQIIAHHNYVIGTWFGKLVESAQFEF